MISAIQIRNSSDYDDFYIVSKANAEEQYRKVDEMMRVIIDYLCKLEEQ
jgi:HEPN domain protein